MWGGRGEVRIKSCDTTFCAHFLSPEWIQQVWVYAIYVPKRAKEEKERKRVKNPVSKYWNGALKKELFIYTRHGSKAASPPLSYDLLLLWQLFLALAARHIYTTQQRNREWKVIKQHELSYSQKIEREEKLLSFQDFE